MERGAAFEYRFEGYWKDVGTPDAYWQAHQDLLDGTSLDLDDRDWPIRTTGARRPPARITASASVDDSLVSPASRVSGRVVRSVLSPGVVVEEGAVVRESVLLDDVVIRAGAEVRRAIVDRGVEVKADSSIGGDDAEEITVVGNGSSS